jgi:hypothetical protein
VALRAKPGEPKGFCISHSTPTVSASRAFRNMGIEAPAEVRRFSGFRENGAHCPSVALDRRWADTACVSGGIMSNQAVETGWQRFLDRLKQLWGKLGQAGQPSAAAG